MTAAEHAEIKRDIEVVKQSVEALGEKLASYHETNVTFIAGCQVRCGEHEKDIENLKTDVCGVHGNGDSAGLKGRVSSLEHSRTFAKMHMAGLWTVVSGILIGLSVLGAQAIAAKILQVL